MTEAAFFCLGVLPYWYTLALPDKSRRYWLVLVWCCCVWFAYFVAHGQPAPAVNNAVELVLAVAGLRRLAGRQVPQSPSSAPSAS